MELENNQIIPNPNEIDVPKPDEENDNNESSEDNTGDQLNRIVETGEVVVGDGERKIHCLTIIGQIEGHYILGSQNKTTKYEHVIPSLVAVDQEPSISGLLIILNTVGGDVEAGLAIAELIAGMKKPTASLVLGGGHSIGVPLACAAKRSFIVPSATMTIHPVRMNGLVLGVPQTLSYFDKMQDRIIKFVTANSKIKEEDFRSLALNTGQLIMDMGSIIDGEESVALGLIDEIGGLKQALDWLKEQSESGYG